MVSSVFRIVIIGVIIAITIGVIGTVSFGWTLNTSIYLQGLANFLHVIYYVLPIGKLSPIIFCFVALMVLRIAVSLVRTIWSLIPING